MLSKPEDLAARAAAAPPPVRVTIRTPRDPTRPWMSLGRDVRPAGRCPRCGDPGPRGGVRPVAEHVTELESVVELASSRTRPHAALSSSSSCSTGKEAVAVRTTRCPPATLGAGRDSTELADLSD